MSDVSITARHRITLAVSGSFKLMPHQPINHSYTYGTHDCFGPPIWQCYPTHKLSPLKCSESSLDHIVILGVDSFHSPNFATYFESTPSIFAEIFAFRNFSICEDYYFYNRYWEVIKKAFQNFPIKGHGARGTAEFAIACANDIETNYPPDLTY